MTAKPTLLLLGTGLMGGDLLMALIKSNKYDITVTSRNDDGIKVLQGLGVKTIRTSLADHKTLTEAVAAHDITINAASADDVDAAKALIAGLSKSSGSVKKTFIQISGAGVYGHLFSPHQPIDTVYDDNDPDEINKLSPTAPHRAVDLLFLEASKTGKANIVIAIPSTVYGVGTGPFKNYSIQVPMKIDAALQDGYASYGAKDGIFTHVHVADHTKALIAILDGIESGKLNVDTNPYVNISNRQRSTWSTVVKRLAEQMHKRGLLPTAEVKTKGDWDFYGIYDTESSRLRELGWSEEYGTEADLLAGVDHEVESYVKKTSANQTGAASQIVLVTGGSGWVGGAVVLALLRHPFNFVVRLALRSRDKFEDWIKKYPEYSDRLQFVLVKSLTEKDAYAEAIKGVTYVAHTASPGIEVTENVARDMLDPAIQGTLGILRSAEKEPSVRAIVFTSSIASYVDFTNPRSPNEPPYGEKDWNPTTYETAASLPQEGLGVMISYAASKALADRAAFEFVAKAEPKWTLTAIAPSWVTGPTEQPRLETTADLASTSAGAFGSLIDVKTVTPCSVPYFVDVRDAARAHVEALVNPIAAGRRYLLAAGRTNFEEASVILKKAFPESAGRIADAEPTTPAPVFGVEGNQAEKDFGFKYITFEQSIKDWGKQVLALPVPKK